MSPIKLMSPLRRATYTSVVWLSVERFMVSSSLIFLSLSPASTSRLLLCAARSLNTASIFSLEWAAEWQEGGRGWWFEMLLVCQKGICKLCSYPWLAAPRARFVCVAAAARVAAIRCRCLRAVSARICPVFAAWDVLLSASLQWAGNCGGKRKRIRYEEQSKIAFISSSPYLTIYQST